LPAWFTVRCPASTPVGCHRSSSAYSALAAARPVHVVVCPWPLPHRLLAVGSSTWDTTTPDASTSTTELTTPLHGTVHGGAMAVHRLQPSPSGLQCSTARSPVLLHGPRLTGARTGMHPLLLYFRCSSSCTSCATCRLALLRREGLPLLPLRIPPLVSHLGMFLGPTATILRRTVAAHVTPRPIPGPAVLTLGSSLGSYIVPTDQHESFVCTLSSLMRTRENFPVGHPSQIAPSQARLTWRFFRNRLPKKKMHLFGMDTLLILLSLGPGNHHPWGQDITIHPLRRSTSSSVNPNPGTFPFSHICVSSVVICHAM
jgi:hypothetical protein